MVAISFPCPKDNPCLHIGNVSRRGPRAQGNPISFHGLPYLSHVQVCYHKHW